MKNFNLFTTTLLMLCISGSIMLFISCQKESLPPIADSEETEMAGKYSKIVTLTDKAHTSWVKIRVSADDESILNNMPELRLNTELGSIEPNPSPDFNTPAESWNASNTIHFDVLEQHLAPDAEGIYLSLNSAAGVQDRASVFVSFASNCGFGWKVIRTSGPTFTVAHYKGDACAYPNTFVGTWLNRNFYSTGYFWGMRHRVVVAYSGTITISHGQFQPGNW